MTKEEFLTQIEKYKWDNTGLERVLKSDEAKLSLSDRDTVLASLSINEKVFEFASEELKSDKEFVIRVFKEVKSINGGALQYASQKLKADKEVVMAAVSNNGGALKYASMELKADKEVVMAAKDTQAINYASEELKSDREFVIQVVLANGTTLRYASDDLKADKEVVTAAVSQKGSALEYASDDLKADKEVVMAAVSHEGSALEYASDELKADREIVTKAIHKDVFVLEHVSNELKDSIIDKTVKLERHFDDGYGTVYCIGRTYMSLPQLHGYFEIWCGTKETLFDTKSEDSLIKFLNSEIDLFNNSDKHYWEIESKISWDDWQQLKCDLNDVMDLPDFGEDAGNNVDDLKIFVNEELIVTF